MIWLLLSLYFFGIEAHAAEWSHYDNHRWMAAFWPVFAAISALCGVLGTVWWVVGFRWRWRVTWVRRPKIDMWRLGWTYKGKQIGIFWMTTDMTQIVDEKWTYSGLVKGGLAIGTLTVTPK